MRIERPRAAAGRTPARDAMRLLGDEAPGRDGIVFARAIHRRQDMDARRFERILIGGSWVAAEDGCYPVINPETEEPAGLAPQCSVAQVGAAIAAAREAFDRGPWPRMSV